MTYILPEYITKTRLKRGRTEYYTVEGFLTKEEAQQYADHYYRANMGYGPSSTISLQENGTWTVFINQMDSCD